METPTTSPEPLKSSFPDLVIDIEALVKISKNNVIVDWLKSQLQKLSSSQCSELLGRCTELLRKPEDGKEHSALIDAKWKLVQKIDRGIFTIKPTVEAKGDSDFKLMLLWVTVLKEEMLTQYMKDIVDFIPKAKPHGEIGQ